MRPLAFLMGALAGSALAPGPRQQAQHRPSPRARTQVKTPAASFGAIAIGTGAAGPLIVSSLAVGAVAFGALAIGALAIGRLGVRKARFQDVEIDSLTVRKLRIVEDGEDSEPAP